MPSFEILVHADVCLVNLGIEHARNRVLAVARYVREQRPDQFLVFNHQLAVLLVLLRTLRVGRFGVVAENTAPSAGKPPVSHLSGTAPWFMQ